MGTLPLKITDPMKQLSALPDMSVKYSDAEKAKLANAAKQFESLLTSMMIKSMTQTTKGMFGDDSFGGDYYDTIFQNEIASFISKNKSLGVADMIYKKMTGEDITSSPLPAAKPLNNGNLNIKKDTNPAPVEKPVNIEKLNIKGNLNGIPSITPSPATEKRLNRYDNIIEKAAETFGVNKNIIKSVILTESAANDKAVSGAKAKGLMQLIDSTASDMGVGNIWDPKQNIFGGTKYLAGLLRKYNGNLNLALASYNAGPENVDKYNGIPPFEETQNYVTRVNGYLKHFNGAEDGND